MKLQQLGFDDALAAEGGGAMAAALPRTVIEPTHAWQLINLKELWRYRELISILAWRDIRVRYKQTLFGASWAILQPLMMVVVFTIVFHRVAGFQTGAVPYPLFVLAGLLLWTLFSAALTGAAGSVVGSERLITKIYFPRLAVPLAAIGVAIIDFLVACLFLAVAMLWYRISPSVLLWLAPLVAMVTVMLAAGIGIALAALNVSFRDVRYLIPFAVQLGLYATPTIYMDLPLGDPGRLSAWLITANPMATLVAAFRNAIVGGPIPWASLGTATVAAIIVLLAGALLFRKVEDGFADVI